MIEVMLAIGELSRGDELYIFMVTRMIDYPMLWVEGMRWSKGEDAKNEI